MAKTLSNMLPLGTLAPDFFLLNPVTGHYESLSELKLKSDIATVIMFISNHCPFVKLIKTKISEIAHVYQKQNIKFIALCSNDIEKYPEDSPENMAQDVKDFNYPFSYLFDETQEVAKAYQAACTPDFYIFDHNLQCIYRGQFDDARPGNGIEPTGKDLTQALDCVLTHQPISQNQKPSLGCNIKWKSPEIECV